MGYQLITNMQPRQLHCLADLPEKARAEFDYVDECDSYSPRFVQYRGTWYDAHDTQAIRYLYGELDRMGWAVHVHPGEPLAQFDSILGESYFSGVAFRFVGDDECIVARYFS